MSNEFFGNGLLAAVPVAPVNPVNMAQAQVATNANQGTMPSNSYGFTTGIPNPTAPPTRNPAYSGNYVGIGSTTGFTTGIPNPASVFDTAPPTHNPAYDASGNYIGIDSIANAQATVAGGVNAAQGNTGGATAAPAAQGKGGISPLLLIGGAAVAGIVIFMVVSKKKGVNNVK
jgi:hypothetical protein